MRLWLSPASHEATWKPRQFGVIDLIAGGDKIAFPENHAAGMLYTTVDRADNKQFRELFTSAAALDAAEVADDVVRN